MILPTSKNFADAMQKVFGGIPLRQRIENFSRFLAERCISAERNQYLDADQRRHAVALHQALEEARQLIEAGERNGTTVHQAVIARIEATPGAQLDYAAVFGFALLHCA